MPTSNSFDDSRKRPDPRKLSREEALELSNEEKELYFDEVTINHPKLSSTLKELEKLVFPSIGGGLVLLVGPPGVGKSELIDLLEKRTLARYRAEMQADTGILPIVVMNAGSAGDKAFSWKNFYITLQRLLGGQVQSTISGLRDGVEKTLHWRRTRIVVIDEGVHLLRGASDRAIVGHIDSLKSLASISGVTIILSGSYDLLRVLTMSGQIARRIKLVHFQRYLAGVESDETAFRMTMTKLGGYIPVEGVPSLEPWGNQLHQCTLGCIGVLNDIFMASLKNVISSGGPWTLSHLSMALPTAAQLDAMIRETEEGEKLLERTDFESGAWDVIKKLQRSLSEEGGGRS